jgi:CBS domain-containing protein
MRADDVMTYNPACCLPDTPLQDVAELMVECDCGEIPVVETRESMRPVGVITDRDITCRAVARGVNPLELTARDCMSSPPVMVRPATDVEECMRLMEKLQIRRLPVVDDGDRCCGIVALADIAKRAKPTDTGETVKEVSRPTQPPSRVR